MGVAGCGGDDDESTSADQGKTAVIEVQSTSMPVAQYTKKANSACIEELGKISGVVRNAIVTNSPVKVEVVLPPVESMLTKLTDLGAPDPEKPEVEAFLAALQKDLQEAEEFPDPTVSLQKLARTFQESADLAAKLKLEACELA